MGHAAVAAKVEVPFEGFHRQIVVFDTRKVVAEPAGFQSVLPTVSLGTIFYHFIDARQRNQDAVDDFATTEIDTPVVIDVLPNDDFQLGAILYSVIV